MNKRMIVAVDTSGTLRAIGPVYKDESIEQVSDQIEAAGWTVLPQSAIYQSVTDLRAELKRAAQEG